MQKGYPMQLQKINTPTDRAQRVDTKNGGHLSICHVYFKSYVY